VPSNYRHWFSLKWHGHLGREFARAEPALSGAKGCPCHLKLNQYRIIDLLKEMQVAKDKFRVSANEPVARLLSLYGGRGSRVCRLTDRARSG
jgi:hypothetical protein